MKNGKNLKGRRYRVKKKNNTNSEVIKVQSLHGISGSRVENIHITKLEGLFKIFHWIG